MTSRLFRTASRWLSVPVATLALATSAYADGGHDASTPRSAPKAAQEHEMTADEHAGMSAGEHGMTADEHAGMSAGEHGMTADEHAQMKDAKRAPAAQATPSAAEPGKSADEHAAHGDTAEVLPPASEHGAHGGSAGGQEAGAGGHDDGGHDSAAAPKDRPVGLALAGFGVINGLVVLYAAVIRRRPDALKRRQTLQRVRSTPPKQTVFPSSSSSEKQS